MKTDIKALMIRPETHGDYKDIVSLVLRSFSEGTNYSDGTDIVALIEEIRDSDLNLKERRNHLPGQLSGGQQQRVAIGRALFTRPSLILADEPTGNLDSQNTNEVIALLKETSKKYEQTIVMITHSRSIAGTADRILKVSDGMLKDFGRQ